MDKKKAKKVSAAVFASFLALTAIGLLIEGQTIAPPPAIQLTGYITLHERRPQDYLVIGLHLWRPGAGPITNAKVVVNGVPAPHCSPGDYSGGSAIGDIAPGMRLNLSIYIDGKEVVTGGAALAATARFSKPRADERIDRRLARLVPVEWAFSSGSWTVDLRVRKLPEKNTVFFRDGIRANHLEVPTSGFPPACDADILVHFHYGAMPLTGSLTADSSVKLGYSAAQYVRTIN